MKHARTTALLLLLSLILSGLIAGCAANSPAVPVVVTVTPPVVVVTPVPTPTPTPAPKTLTICSTEEPNTLFLYGGPNLAAYNVLQAVYDGPIDNRAYSYQPVILDKLPNLADGDAHIQTVLVNAGDTVVNSSGSVVLLDTGTLIVNAAGETVRFEGAALEMQQMVARFRLLEGVKWSNGQPLTADDSVYSFELAGVLGSPAVLYLRERTASYVAEDSRTTVWTGLPGYRDPLYFTNFYHPLPRQMWGHMAPERLLDAEISRRLPVGWGPYVISGWVPGDRITMLPNTHYHRAGEGLPALRELTFRFVENAQQASAQLLSGACDVLTPESISEEQVSLLLDTAQRGIIQVTSSPDSVWDHLDFGIDPVDSYNPQSTLADAQTRQAIALCVNRQRLIDELTYGQGEIAHSYVSVAHPMYASDALVMWPYDPAAGQARLESLGWSDVDGDGVREYYGSDASLSLVTTADVARYEAAAGLIAADLAACGLEVVPEYLPAGEFYADGPDGPLFGRHFDLSLFAWMNGSEIPCDLYLSSEIPTADNWWSTSNNTGYSNPSYDAACENALRALPGSDDYVNYHREAQRIFSTDLPVLPLFYGFRLAAAQPSVLNLALDSTEPALTWNIESLDVVR